jgi:acetyl-CoA C-acetyltransferase
MSKEIVLVGAVRTAIGKFGGTLSNVPVADIGAIVIKEAIVRAGIQPSDIDEVIMGCCL